MVGNMHLDPAFIKAITFSFLNAFNFPHPDTGMFFLSIAQILLNLESFQTQPPEGIVLAAMFV